MHLCHSIRKQFEWIRLCCQFLFRCFFFFLLVAVAVFVVFVVHKSKHHEVSICTWHYEKSMCSFFFNFYANYVISFKIFMLSNFKHEFCMSHIILWQRRWLQQHQQQHSAVKKTSFNYLAQIWIPEKNVSVLLPVFLKSI